MEEELDDIYLKRERRRKEEIRKSIAKMRDELPAYSLEDIRQYRLPYHEALLLALDEKGFASTASFVRELFDFQEDLRKQAGPSSHVWLRPQLVRSRKELDALKESLVKSELAHSKGDHATECEQLLQVATRFAFGHSDWWWLGEQLLLQAVKTSKEYAGLRGKYEALGRFVYARFLVEKLREFEDAVAHLQVARELSQGKGWNSRGCFPEEKGTLFMQVNQYLYECLYRNVLQLMNVDFVGAIAVAVEARRRAADACYHAGETKSLILKGVCEMNLKEVKSAVKSFQRAYHLEARFGTPEGLCKVRIQLAKAYLMDGNTAQSLKTLVALKTAAEAHQLPFYLGQAYKNLGEYYLSNGHPDKANPLLNEALKILYRSDSSTDDVEMVRNLEAISSGSELLPAYVEVMREAGTAEGFNSLMRLIDWKDERVVFWEEKRAPAEDSFVEIISESVKKDVDVLEKEMSASTKLAMIEGEGKEVVELHDNKEAFVVQSVTTI